MGNTWRAAGRNSFYPRPLYCAWDRSGARHQRVAIQICIMMDFRAREWESERLSRNSFSSFYIWAISAIDGDQDQRIKTTIEWGSADRNFFIGWGKPEGKSEGQPCSSNNTNNVSLQNSENGKRNQTKFNHHKLSRISWRHSSVQVWKTKREKEIWYDRFCRNTSIRDKIWKTPKWRLFILQQHNKKVPRYEVSCSQ